MPDHIYISTGEGKLEALTEQAFASEDEFQVLVSKHPELLDGEQIAPGNPRRWILIRREKGIAEAPGQGAKWAVDLLLIDQDGIPTLAELKRGSNPEIRRAIVGQLLEYAAHASTDWTAEGLREEFELRAKAEKFNAQEEIARLLQSEEESLEEDFWNQVSTNLAAKRLRLLFVADKFPKSLARVVEFLNEQMSAVEVLGVEITQFSQGIHKTLVPKIIGRTSAAPEKTVHRKLNLESFLAEFQSDQVRNAAKRLLEVARQNKAEIYFGSTGLSIRARSPAWPKPFSIAWLYPHNQAGWMSTKEFSFGEASSSYWDLPQSLQEELDGWVQTMSSQTFAQDASSKGVRASTVDHDTAVKNIDLLVQHLQEVLERLATLQP